MKLPSYCQISTRPYSRETFTEEEGAPETVIRFRKVRNEHGEERVESNARMVRWSDGSTSLLIGDGEALQVSSQVRTGVWSLVLRCCVVLCCVALHCFCVVLYCVVLCCVVLRCVVLCCVCTV